MAIMLNEEIVENLVNQVNQDNPAFQFDWRNYALTTVREGRTTNYGLFLENESYFALVEVNMFDVATIRRLTFMDKKEIQGARIRKGVINTILKIRMFNGESYKMIFNPRAGKKLPRHAENLEHYRNMIEREFSDRTDLKDRNTSLLMKFWNLLTWGAAIIATFFAIVMFRSRTLALAVFVAVAFIMFWIGSQFQTLSFKKKDSAFLKEFQFLESQRSGQSDEVYYQALQNIREKPSTEYYQSIYYGQLIQLAHQLGHVDQANSYLELFPRRHSDETEATYQSLVNLLTATPEKKKENQ